jgi:iron complex transport system permease protein
VKRTWSALAIAAALLLLTAALGALVGAVRIAPLDALRALASPGPATEWQRAVLLGVRLPRVTVAALSGAALAVSGCALQGLFRNPLADPGVLGVSSGAALGAVIAIYSGLTLRFPSAVALASCLGALAVTLLVYMAATRLKSGASTALLLTGVAAGQLAAAASSLVITLSLADYAVSSQIVRWLLGGFEARSWLHVAWGVGPIGAGLVLVLLDARGLDALLLGELGATAVGIDVSALRRRLVISSALLTGASVAIGGSVAFVGLLVPHLLRRWLGARHLPLVAVSAVGGGVLMVLADLLSRTIAAPAELPVGVITAALGAPLFLSVLLREARRSPVPS